MHQLLDVVSTLAQVLIGVSFIFAALCAKLHLRNLNPPVGPIVGAIQMAVGVTNMAVAAIYLLLMGLFAPSAFGFAMIIAGVLLVIGGFLFLIGRENRSTSE